jgi:hypothetical protein
MKLPTKNVKENRSLPVLSNPSFRKEFLDDLPNKGGSRVRGTDIALINQALRAIEEGTATINGKTPNTRIQRFIVIASYFKAVGLKSHMSFDGTVHVKDNCTVSLRHNEQQFSFSFPESIPEN